MSIASPPRRHALKLLSALPALPLLSACWQHRPLAIAAHRWPGYALLFLASDQGWLKSSAVQLIPSTSATDSLERLASGAIDGAALTLDEVLRARENGLDLVIVLIFDVSAGADMLLGKPTIRQLSQLSRKRIGYEASALGALMLTEILDRAQILPQDITKVPLTAEHHLTAWRENRVDALITYEPFASELVAEGAYPLYDSRQMPGMIYNVLAIRAPKFSQRNGIESLAAAHFAALQHFKTQRFDAAYRMANHLKLAAPQVLQVFNGLHLPDARGNFGYLTGTPAPIMTAAERLSQIMVRNGLLQSIGDLNDLIDASYLPGAK